MNLEWIIRARHIIVKEMIILAWTIHKMIGDQPLEL